MKTIILSFLCLFMISFLFAQVKPNKELQSLVNTERSFAQLAKDQNTKEAFLANLNEESLGVEQNVFVKSKKTWDERQADKATLSWEPVFADIAASGDFGYTTGPWNYRTASTSNPIAFGDYITIWRKQQDGQWKIVIDLGITHPKPEEPKPITYSSIPLMKTKISKADFKTEVLNIEKKFMDSVKTKGYEAYTSFSSNEIRLFRNNQFPFNSWKAVQDKLKDDIQNITATVADVEVSSSGDMAFSYGMLNAQDNSPKGTFMRIWKKEDKKIWKLVLEIISQN